MTTPASAVPDWSALLAEQRRFWRRLWNVPRVMQQARETRVGISPADVILADHTHRLLRYRRDTPARYAQPVLFCYALINRPYILDLQPDKSVVRQYLERGFEVYLIDWGVPGPRDRGLSLASYVCGFLRRSVTEILARHGRPDLHLLGYCMGGTLATLWSALHPETVRSLTLLAAPIDFAVPDSLLGLWTDARRFDVDTFLALHGNCPAWFLQALFLGMKPIQNFMEKGLGFCEQMDDERFVTSYFAMERWINDNIPVAGATFREFVRDLYQENRLVRGQLRLGEQPIDLRRITCPTLLLTARQDQLVPPASTEGIRPHLGSADVESKSVDAGHVGLVVGGKAQKVLWPAATSWLADRSTSPLAAPGSEHQLRTS